MTQRQVRRGFVLGAGGALGAAWMLGVLSALHDEEGCDPLSADIVVGTSAGSVLAALFGCGRTVPDLVDRLAHAGSPHLDGTAPVNVLDVHAALKEIPRPIPLPGSLGLAARSTFRLPRHPLMTVAAGLAPRGRGDLEPLSDMIAEAQGSSDWPSAPTTWVVAMDFASGRRTVFGRADAPSVPLPRAVIASCAAPGFFPPVTIGDRRYVDGGAVSMTNADALLRSALDEVIVLAPMAAFGGRRGWSPAVQADRRLRHYLTRRLNNEVRQLTAAGVQVRTFAPTPDDLAVMGINMMNPSRRHEVLLTAQETTRVLLAGDLVSAEPASVEEDVADVG